MQFKCKFKSVLHRNLSGSKGILVDLLIQPYKWAKLRFRFFIRTNKCAVFFFFLGDQMKAAHHAGLVNVPLSGFLTRWRSIMPKLGKSLRWPASAYAHYLWEHAASWLPFTKAGTQGQREWEWEMCVLTPSDETLPQLCVHTGRFLCVSLWRPASLCALTCLLSILFSKISYIDCLF